MHVRFIHRLPGLICSTVVFASFSFSARSLSFQCTCLYVSQNNCLKHNQTRAKWRRQILVLLILTPASKQRSLFQPRLVQLPSPLSKSDQRIETQMFRLLSAGSYSTQRSLLVTVVSYSLYHHASLIHHKRQ